MLLTPFIFLNPISSFVLNYIHLYLVYIGFYVNWLISYLFKIHYNGWIKFAKKFIDNNGIGLHVCQVMWEIVYIYIYLILLLLWGIFAMFLSSNRERDSWFVLGKILHDDNMRLLGIILVNNFLRRLSICISFKSCLYFKRITWKNKIRRIKRTQRTRYILFLGIFIILIIYIRTKEEEILNIFLN